MEEINLNEDKTPESKVETLTKLADAFNKAVAASTKVLPETNRLAVAMETVRAFGDFVREKRPAVAMDFIELIEEFAPELERRFA